MRLPQNDAATARRPLEFATMKHLPSLLLAVSMAGALALPSGGAPQLGETTPPAVVTPSACGYDRRIS